MKISKSYFYTLREDAKDEESRSGNLLVRSGMIKKVGAGIYMYLPMGLRTFDKVKRVIKEEMDFITKQKICDKMIDNEKLFPKKKKQNQKQGMCAVWQRPA